MLVCGGLCLFVEVCACLLRFVEVCGGLCLFVEVCACLWRFVEIFSWL